MDAPYRKDIGDTLVTVATGIRVRLVLGLALLCPAVAGGQPPTADSPEHLLERWQAALAQGDLSAYLDCLHPGARQTPEYGSREAMVFWAGEMRDLARRGFEGRFDLEIATEGGGRFPPGSVMARPVVNGRPIRKAIVLVEHDQRWTILRLFS